MASVFVTGGSGFVGGAVVRALVASGARVRVLCRGAPSAEKMAGLGAQPVLGDLAARDALRHGMAGASLVVHAAAMVSDWGPVSAFQASTIDGTRHMLAAAREAGVHRFVHISTEAVLAGGGPIVDADETTPYPARPCGLYPWSKAVAERAVLAANAPGFETIALRPRFVWGRGDTSLLPQLTRAMRQGVWRWFGGGRHLMSTCHIGNLVEGVRLAAEHGRGGEAYFLTDGAPVEMRGFLTALAATQGVVAPAGEAPMAVAQALAAAGEFAWRALRLRGRPPLTRTALNLLFMQVTVNDAKARRELGYRGAVTREAGLAELRADAGAGEKTVCVQKD